MRRKLNILKEFYFKQCCGADLFRAAPALGVAKKYLEKKILCTLIKLNGAATKSNGSTPLCLSIHFTDSN